MDLDPTMHWPWMPFKVGYAQPHKSYPPVGFIRELLRLQPYNFVDTHVELPCFQPNSVPASEKEEENYSLIDASMNRFLDNISAEMDAEVPSDPIDEDEEVDSPPKLTISKLDHTDEIPVSECGEGFVTATPADPIIEEEVKECFSDVVTRVAVNDKFSMVITTDLINEITEVKDNIQEKPVVEEEVELIVLQAPKPKVTDCNKLNLKKSIQPSKVAVQPVASSTFMVDLKSGSSKSPRDIDWKNTKVKGKDDSLPAKNLVTRRNNAIKEKDIVKPKAIIQHPLDKAEEFVDELPEPEPARIAKKFRVPFRPNTERFNTYTHPTTSKIIERPPVGDLTEDIGRITASFHNILFISSPDTLVKSEPDTVLENKCENEAQVLSEKTKKKNQKEKRKLAKEIVQRSSDEKPQQPEKLIENIAAVDKPEKVIASIIAVKEAKSKKQTPAPKNDGNAKNIQAENPKGEKSIKAEQEAESPELRKFDHKTIPVWMKKRKISHRKQRKDAECELEESECECQKRCRMGQCPVEEVQLIILQGRQEVDESNPIVDQPVSTTNPNLEHVETHSSPRKSGKHPQKVVSGFHCCQVCMLGALSAAFCGGIDDDNEGEGIEGQDDSNAVESWIHSHGEVGITEGVKAGDVKVLKNQETVIVGLEGDTAQPPPPPPPSEPPKRLSHAKKLIELIQPKPVSPIVAADTDENNEAKKVIKPSTS